MIFDQVIDKINRGKEGLNKGLPMGFNRLVQFVPDIQHSTYYLIGGETGTGKCLGKGTKVMMYDGTFKVVEEVKIGDQLMGPDSTPRNVLSLGRGRDTMYKISQTRGIDYIVNSEHILSLKEYVKPQRNRKVIPGQLDIEKNKRKRYDNVLKPGYYKTINISIKDYLKKDKTFKRLAKGYKAGRLTFQQGKELPIDPYFLGLWLGDGSSSKPQITTVDLEIIKYLNDYANENGHKVTKDDISYSLTYGDNKIITRLKDLKVYKNKHIPQIYKTTDIGSRLQLLAGLIDSDGFKDKNSYEITQANKQLANDIAEVARSLGIYTSITKKSATMKREDGSVYTASVYRLYLSGNIYDIPCKIVRKMFLDKTNISTESLHTSIIVEELGEDDYYGFTLDGDHLFLLEDLTVTHNTAFADNCFLYNPYNWIKKNPESKIKMKIVYWSFEIDKVSKITKGICKKLYTDYNIITDINFVLSRGKNRISQEIYDKVLETRNYFEEMEDVLEIFDGTMNPTGINRRMLNLARENGEYLMKTVDDGKGGKLEVFDRYIPHNPDLYTMVFIDHVSLTKKEQGMTTKETIDRLSEYLIPLRNNFGFIPVVVQQIGRGNSTSDRMKLDRLEPQLSDFKDSGNTQQDANVIMSLFSPRRYELDTFRGYDIKKLKDRYRSLMVLKNRDGESDVRIGLHFVGEAGHFSELPKSKDFETDPKLYDKYGNIIKYGTN